MGQVRTQQNPLILIVVPYLGSQGVFGKQISPSASRHGLVTQVFSPDEATLI